MILFCVIVTVWPIFSVPYFLRWFIGSGFFFYLLYVVGVHWCVFGKRSMERIRDTTGWPRVKEASYKDTVVLSIETNLVIAWNTDTRNFPKRTNRLSATLDLQTKPLCLSWSEIDDWRNIKSQSMLSPTHNPHILFFFGTTTKKNLIQNGEMIPRQRVRVCTPIVVPIPVLAVSISVFWDFGL